MQPQHNGGSGTAEVAEDQPRAEALRAPSAPRRLGDRAILALNLLLFLAAGTLLCFWFWRNSDWFEEFGAMLTFSGVLSWAAMALKIVPEEKVTVLQGVFFVRMFEDRRALKWHAIALGLVVAGTLCFATVQIEPFHEAVERPVVVDKIDGAAPAADYWAKHLEAEDFEVLKPGQTLRVVVPVWWGQARVVVAVGGYPEKTLALAPWERRELVAPSSFRRPVVLLRPTADLMGEIALAPRTLVVKQIRAGYPRATRSLVLDGRPIWLGCDDHVDVPPLWRDTWAKEEGWARHMGKWLFPTALSLDGELTPGDEIALEITGPTGVDWTLRNPHVIAPLIARTEFLPDIIKIGK